MKLSNIILFLICVCESNPVYSQNWVENLKKIHSKEALSTFLIENPLLDAEELTYFSLKDTNAFAQKIFAKTIGDVFLEDSSAYKIWSEEADSEFYFKVSYIYFNAKMRTQREIDSLRPLIIREYKQGIPFQTLAKQYTMDGNRTGDLDWFKAGRMILEFETAVQNAVKGSIFTVDVPDNDWFYVVLKTHEPQRLKTRTVFKITY